MSSACPTRFQPPSQHHHMIELQALGAVGGEQKQSPLLAAYLTPPTAPRIISNWLACYSRV